MTTTTTHKARSRRFGVRKSDIAKPGMGQWLIIDNLTGWFTDRRNTRAAAANLAKLLNKKEAGL